MATHQSKRPWTKASFFSPFQFLLHLSAFASVMLTLMLINDIDVHDIIHLTDWQILVILSIQLTDRNFRLLSGFTPRTLSLSGEERALSRLRSFNENSPLIGGKGANCECLLGPSFDWNSVVQKYYILVPRPKEFGSEGQKLSAAESCCDWSWRMSWRESLVSTSSTMFRSRSNSPHSVSSRQFNFEPLETLSTHHIKEPVKDGPCGTI